MRTRARLGQAVQDFGRALAGADVGLFYYAGHGLQVQGVNWLVPVDANPTRPQDLDFQMVDADLVLRQMDGAGTKLNLVLLDACRNNPFATRGLRSLQAGLAEMRAPEGTLISYATQPGNVAADGGGRNSPYTAALAASMVQPGLDVFRTFNQVGLQVKRATGGSQQPWVSTSPIDGEFHFMPAGPQVAAVVRPPDLPAAPAPADPTERMRAAVLAQRCAILDSKRVGDQFEVVGLAPPDPAWDMVLKQEAPSRGIRRVRMNVEILPGFACDVVDALAETVRATRAAAGGLFALPRRSVTLGEGLAVPLRGVGGTVLLDLFRPDGTVRHVPAGDPAALNIPASSLPSAGTRLLTVLASPSPLTLGRRPATEPTAAYLAALAPVLRGADVQADVVTIQIRPAATPAAAVARPSRCGGILERAQLGEALSDADQAYLRAECR